MPTSLRSIRSTSLCLALLLSASVLPACSPLSTRPVIEPTLPPVVSCDQTPPAAQVPDLPPVTTAPSHMLEAMDTWALQMLGLYTREVTIRHNEHACMDQLRKQKIIQ
jgi:hypothetical protein